MTRARPVRRSCRAGALLAALLTLTAVAGCRDDPPRTSGATPASASTGSAPAGSPSTGPAATYYLSLGDSLAFGFQQRRFARLVGSDRYAPALFPGYTSLVARRLATVRRPVRAVNYGCPGETTATLVRGGCPVHNVGLRLHDDYSGSQLSAATRFLRAHRGRTALVTLAIGGNDLGALRGRCDDRARCLRAALPEVAAAAADRVRSAVHALRAADPAVVVVVLTVYDPLAAEAPGTAPLVRAFDDRLAGAARAAGARVADALTAFGTGRDAVCRFTLYCRDRDVHPSDAGYAVLGDALWKAADVAAR